MKQRPRHIDGWLKNSEQHRGGRYVGISYPGVYAVSTIDANQRSRPARPRANRRLVSATTFRLTHLFLRLVQFSQLRRPRPNRRRQGPASGSHEPPGRFKFLPSWARCEATRSTFMETSPTEREDGKDRTRPYWQLATRCRTEKLSTRDDRRSVVDAKTCSERHTTSRSRSRVRALTTYWCGPWYHGGWSRSDGDTLGECELVLKPEILSRELELP